MRTPANYPFESGYTLLEMTVVLVLISSMLCFVIPITDRLEQRILEQFTDTVLHDLELAQQLPYVSGDGSCVPRFRWYIAERMYTLSCGNKEFVRESLPEKVKVTISGKTEIMFSQTSPSYAGTWMFVRGEDYVTLRFRLGSYDPEVISYQPK